MIDRNLTMPNILRNELLWVVIVLTCSNTIIKFPACQQWSVLFVGWSDRVVTTVVISTVHNGANNIICAFWVWICTPHGGFINAITVYLSCILVEILLSLIWSCKCVNGQGLLLTGCTPIQVGSIRISTCFPIVLSCPLIVSNSLSGAPKTAIATSIFNATNKLC